MKERMGSIYLVKNLITGKCYVGQTVQDPRERIRQHRKESENGSQKYFHVSIRYHGFDNFVWCWLHYKNLPKKKLNQYERYYIWIYGTQDNSKGYNITEGGDSPSVTAESIKKQQETMKDPDIRSKWILSIKKGVNKPGVQEGRASKIRGDNNPLRKNEEAIRNHLNAVSSQENKDKISQSMKELWKDSKYRERQLKTRALKRIQKQKEDGQIIFFENE